MKRRRVALGFAMALAAIAPVRPAASSTDCLGTEVRLESGVGDQVSPFLLGIGAGPQDFPDLSAASVGWTDHSLIVSWTTVTPPAVLPSTSDRIRFLLFSYDNGVHTGPPYVFLEGNGAPGDPVVRWRLGRGEYNQRDQQTAHRFVDQFWMPASPTVTANQVSIEIPAKWLYVSESFVTPETSWSGITATEALDQEANNIYGPPSAPVAAVAVNLNDTSSVWGLTDWTPKDAVQGNPYEGYSFSNAPGGASYQPLLCRPDPVMQAGPTVSCDYTWSAVGPAWFAARIDVLAASTSDSISGGYGADLGPGSVSAIGIIADDGEADLQMFPHGSGAWARVGAGPNSLSAPDPVPALDSHEGLGASWRVPLHQFPRSGRWWLVGILSEGASASFSFQVSGSGISCGPQASGTAVHFVPVDAFTEGEAASADFGEGFAGVAAVRSAKTTAQVAHTLVALMGGETEANAALSFDERTPNGTVQRAVAVLPFVENNFFQTVLADVGPAGVYTFGVSTDLEVHRLADWTGLLWADLSLP